jgi:hypothetical protein
MKLAIGGQAPVHNNIWSSLWFMPFSWAHSTTWLYPFSSAQEMTRQLPAVDAYTQGNFFDMLPLIA